MKRLRRHRLMLESMEERRLLAVLTVDTDRDVVDAADGLTSLREAVVMANDLAGADEIVFDFGHHEPTTIQLEEGELQLTEAASITGAGPELLTIDAQQQSRIFHIMAEDGDFAIDGLTLTNGKLTGRQAWGDTTFNGAAVRSISSGTLIVHNCVVRDNLTIEPWSHGGGLFSEGNMTVSSSTILENSAVYGGGLHSNGHVTVNSSTILGNSRGGIRSNGHVTVTSSTISENGGRGIYGSRDVTVNSSTISSNSGGGIRGHKVAVHSSTISGNSALGYDESGGAIRAAGGKVMVTSSTISNNLATSVGGISVRFQGHRSPGDVMIENSILAGNEDSGGGVDLAGIPARMTVSYSLIGSNRGNGLTETPVGSPDASGNLIGGNVGGDIAPLLGPLTDNGGRTFTHAILPGSPAIDAGDPLAMPGDNGVPLNDQRGERFANAVDGDGDGVARIDMGAHEQQNLTASFSTVSSPTVTPVDEVTIQFTRAINGFDLGDLSLSLNGGENLLTGDETLTSSDNQIVVLSGIADAATAAGYYTLTLTPSGSDIMAFDGGQLDSRVSTSWATGRSMLGLTVDTLTDEADGRIDDGDVSLRDAVAAAAPNETISFDSSLDGGRILLTLGELVITRPLTVDATELATGLTIDAAHESRIFEIGDGTSLANSPVTIRGLTLTGGKGHAIQSEEHLTIESASIEENSGWGIDSRADVTVNSSSISYNGGGITGRAVTVKSSTISGNSSSGISAFDAAVVSSTISGNSSDIGGGGIRARNVAVISSTISGNHADDYNFGHGGWGGGISATNVTVDSSTISGNSAISGGAVSATNVTVNSSAIWGNSVTHGGVVSAASVTVDSSTISGNTGGGISAREDATVRFSTIAGNSSSDGAGGVSGGNVTISNSILAANRGLVADLESPAMVTIDHSLIGDNRGTDLPEARIGSLDTLGNLIGGPVSGIIDPRIGPLTDNGGPTFTHALLPGSPAINAGDPLDQPGREEVPLFDQREKPFMRVAKGRIDMGAFESGYRLVGDSNDDGVFDSSDLVMVFQGGKFEDDTANNATFDEGDWNGDGDFDSRDLVFAFQAGQYVTAATPLSAVAAVHTDESDEPLAAGDLDGVFQLDDELLLASDI